MLAPVKVEDGVKSWCTGCLNSCLFCFAFLLVLLFFFLYIPFSFSRLLLKELFSAVYSHNQMTSCLFPPWTAQNIVLYLFTFKLTLIKNQVYVICDEISQIKEISSKQEQENTVLP